MQEKRSTKVSNMTAYIGYHRRAEYLPEEMLESLHVK